jgi:hypothetical protein
MRNTLTNFLAFAAGAAIGSAVTWRFLKKHYEQVADEEIARMREYYLGKVEPVEEDAEQSEEHSVAKQPDILEYANKLTDLGYTNYSDPNQTKAAKVIRVISQDEFDEKDGYDAISLTYYSDGVLADDYDEIIDNADEIVGKDSLACFDDRAQDSVYVRNDTLRRDYEILRDVRRYEDVVGIRPHEAEDEWDET